MTATLHTTAQALDYWRERTKTATKIAQKIIAAAGLERNPQTPVLYAVWLGDQKAAAYIGQSLNGYRRLWDLAIGESHHLANTFPAEMWGSVAVIRWADVLGEELPVLMREIGEHSKTGDSNPLALAGFGFEHLFLANVRPLFNSYKRNCEGELSPVTLERSQSRGAIFAPVCRPYSDRLFERWDAIQNNAATPHSQFASRILL